jgi:hypothetical protein
MAREGIELTANCFGTHDAIDYIACYLHILHLFLILLCLCVQPVRWNYWRKLFFPFISIKVVQEIPVVKNFKKNHKGEILDILLYLTLIKLTMVLFGSCGPLRRWQYGELEGDLTHMVEECREVPPVGTNWRG